jgi:hypothetical protein
MLPLTIGEYMSYDTNKERQRKFKLKMYNAGFKRIYFWIKDEPIKKFLKIELFIKKIEKLLSGLNLDEQSKLFDLIIKILEGKKEVLKLREKEKTNMPEVKGGGKGEG